MLPKERAVTKKSLTPIIIAGVVLLLLIGIVYKLSTSKPTPKIANAPVAAVTTAPAPAAVDASAPVATTTTTTTVATASAPATTVAAASSPAATPLPTDRATAEEELDRLNDEYTRLKTQKASLAKQLEVQNKIIALKEQQIKQLESSAP